MPYIVIIKDSMKKPSIAIDLDDVLASHAEAFIKFSNNYYGTNLSIEDYTEHWAKIWQVTDKEIERRSLEFHTPKRTTAFEIKEKAYSSLLKLKGQYDLYVVTARRKMLVEVTYEWVNQNFPNIFSGVHFVPIWEPNNTVTKAEICKKIGATYLVDDLAQHCNLAADGGIKALLFGDYSWNRHESLHENVTRCKDWDAILAFLICKQLQKDR